jgi:uncharacterized protein YciI
MESRRRILSAMLAALGGTACTRAVAAAPARSGALMPVQSPPAGAPPPDPLFAVELRTGPRWDPAKPAHEQAYFREHSANLKKMRDGGHLLVGARYSDKGFLVMTAPSAAAARELLDADPSVQNQVFAFELHDFRVFYSGCVGAAPGAPRRQSEGMGADAVADAGARR